MANLEGQQFFLPGEGLPTPPPWYRRPGVLLRLGLAAAALFVAAIVVVFIVNKTGESSGNEAENLEDRIAQEMAECETADDAAECEERVRAALARNAATPAACTGLAAEAFNNCVSLIAFDAMDAALCVSLAGDEKTSCEDTATLMKATADSDYALCGEISDDAKRASCEAQILPVVVANGECSNLGIAPERCSEREELNRVIEAGDPDGCAVLATLATDCTELFAALDADQDGLSLAEEHEAGTDPKNADSDGDGYTDGDEVAAGYDPTS